MDSVTFVTQVAGSSTLIGGAGTRAVQFNSAADLATFDGAFGGGSLMSGGGADTLVFKAGTRVSSSTVVKQPVMIHSPL